ncbi:hypothetical protein [Candidatus Phytoplasma sp. AldY-WA1]|jgi:hypothetical protein|uniref:hypothetical protein n=1 Tax=Candidatus Phytoplasma sp. AldY-WA1 TaxID=2852100 RepID=UPI00254C18DF|nr:hypothetical protein [Candidatus Phytoplasma sp. AldY-WA1]
MNYKEFLQKHKKIITLVGIVISTLILILIVNHYLSMKKVIPQNKVHNDFTDSFQETIKSVHYDLPDFTDPKNNKQIPHFKYLTLITRLKDGLKRKDILIIHENNSITGSNPGEIQIVEDINTEITDYIYNNNHQLVEKNTTNYTFSMEKGKKEKSTQKEDIKTKFEYNSDNKLIKEKSYFIKDNSPLDEKTYTYDPHGNKIKENYSSSFNKKVTNCNDYVSEFEYQNGQLKKKKFKETSSSLPQINETIYEYDIDNKLLKENTIPFSSLPTPPSFVNRKNNTIQYEYDEKKQLKSKIEIKNNEILKINMFYDEKNRIIKEIFEFKTDKKTKKFETMVTYTYIDN